MWSLVTQATENEWGQATTPGSGRSLPKTKGQEAPATQSTATSSPKIVSRGSHIPIQGPSLPQSSGLCFCCSPASATAWLAAHSPGGPQAYLKCNSSSLKECGATVGFRHLCGLGEGLAFWSPQMPPGHDCPPTLEAVPGVSHIKLSGHRAIDRTEKRVQSDVLI